MINGMFFHMLDLDIMHCSLLSGFRLSCEKKKVGVVIVVNATKMPRRGSEQTKILCKTINQFVINVKMDKTTFHHSKFNSFE